MAEKDEFLQLQKELEERLKKLSLSLEKLSIEKKKEIRNLILKGYITLQSLTNENRTEKDLVKAKKIIEEIDKKILNRDFPFKIKREFQIIKEKKSFFDRNISVLKIFNKGEEKFIPKNIKNFQWFLEKIKKEPEKAKKKITEEVIDLELIWGDREDY